MERKRFLNIISTVGGRAARTYSPNIGTKIVVDFWRHLFIMWA